MSIIKTDKAEILICVLPKDTTHVRLNENMVTFHDKYTRWLNMRPRFSIIPAGNWQLIGKVSEISDEVAKGIVDGIYVCPSCGGDGKETCNNPDHGFLSAISFRGANESRCPCCGHDPHHKVPNGGKFETCNGIGRVNDEQLNTFYDETGYDDAPDKIDPIECFHSLITSNGYNVDENNYLLIKPRKTRVFLRVDMWHKDTRGNWLYMDNMFAKLSDYHQPATQQEYENYINSTKTHPMTPPPKTPIYQKVKQTLAEKPDELVKYEELIDIKDLPDEQKRYAIRSLHVIVSRIRKAHKMNIVCTRAGYVLKN